MGAHNQEGWHDKGKGGTKRIYAQDNEARGVIISLNNNLRSK